MAHTAKRRYDLTRPTRLTADSGLTTDPVSRPTGKLIAYASDRSGDGNLDIWRQQLATGEAVRLTRDAADESEPAFSPDGSRIAFRSERDGGGIYVVSVFGGEPGWSLSTAAGRGFRPTEPHRVLDWAPGTWAKPLLCHRRRATTLSSRHFASALYPIWSPDGKQVAVAGSAQTGGRTGRPFDWWVAPWDGGLAMKTDGFEILKGQRITDGTTSSFSLTPPAAWLGDRVFFSGWSDESTNLWQDFCFAQDGKATVLAEQLTSGTSIETNPSVIRPGRSCLQVLNSISISGDFPNRRKSGRVTGEQTH